MNLKSQVRILVLVPNLHIVKLYNYYTGRIYVNAWEWGRWAQCKQIVSSSPSPLPKCNNTADPHTAYKVNINWSTINNTTSQATQPGHVLSAQINNDMMGQYIILYRTNPSVCTRVLIYSQHLLRLISIGVRTIDTWVIAR